MPRSASHKLRIIRHYRIVNHQAISRGFLKPDDEKIQLAVSALGKDAEKAVGGIIVYESNIQDGTMTIKESSSTSLAEIPSSHVAGHKL